MKFLTTVHRNKQFAVDVTVTGSEIVYQVRKAFPTATLGAPQDVPSQVNGVDIHGPIDAGDADPSLLAYERNGWSVFGPAGAPVRFDLAAIRDYADFSDCSSFNFFWDYDHLRFAVLPGFVNAGSYRLLEGIRPFNVFAMSRENKFTNQQCATLFLHTKPIGTVIVPFKDSPIEDWVVVFNMFEPSLIRVTPDVEVGETISLDVARYDYLPRVVFDSPSIEVSPDGTATVGLRLTTSEGAPVSNSAEVYIESTGGYLPRSRVLMQNGQGSVRVVARDLEPGESFKVKAGFKYFSGVDECLVKVA